MKGKYQYPEKMIPLMILNALENKALPVYGDGKNVRHWLYVYDKCAGIDMVAHKGACGEIYNIAARNEFENIEIIRRILKILGKREDLITFIRERPGHDRRFLLQTDKVTELGWKTKITLEEGLQKTIFWYRDHKDWWKPLRNWV
jgi:dTDP-glucose 4,6-dehydratase